GIRDLTVTGVQTCALPISKWMPGPSGDERYAAILKERLLARRNAQSNKRRAAKLRQAPSWADRGAIRAIYRRAAAMSRETGVPRSEERRVGKECGSRWCRG